MSRWDALNALLFYSTKSSFMSKPTPQDNGHLTNNCETIVDISKE